ncbi:MAG: hypothetical protein LBR60_03340 [Fibrobacter sp.]|jgi:YbbR domain-containing protein|nr:hypothetical protein [Fibrobacter sp.]
MKHLGLKIVAFIFGITLWFYVASGRTYTIELEVPLTLERIPESMAIASRPPQTLPVLLEGKALDLIQIRYSKTNTAAIVLDLHNAELGTERFVIGKENFNAPDFPKVKFAGLNNIPYLEINFDTRITRTIPIKLNAEFEAASKYTIVQEPQIFPNVVQISGARQALSRISEFPTQKIRFDNLKENDTLAIALAMETLSPFISSSDSVVKAVLEVQLLSRAAFEGVPVNLIGIYDKKEYSLVPATATVEISAGEGILSNLTHRDIDLFIEFNRFAVEDADKLSPTVHINYPIQNFQIHPDKFALKHETPAEDSVKAP